MFTTRFLLLALALLVASVNARPTPALHPAAQHASQYARIIRVKRSTCPKNSTVVVPSVTPTALPIESRSASVSVSSAISSSSPSSSPSSSSRATSTPAVAPSSTRSSSSTSRPQSSTAAPAPTGVIGGLLGSLFPVQGYGNRAWSTSNALGNAAALSDSTFRPHRVLRGTVHSYTNAPDGKRAMRAFYPRGSYTFGYKPQGGFSFYAPGPSNVDLTTAKEATFSYSVYFPRGFAFNLGGKLPGLYGGNSDEEAVGCSGGRRSGACFSARLMWRSGGEGEFYTYLPPPSDSRFSANKKICRLPNSYCHPVYGASVGRGVFSFATGGWTTVSERVRLNDVGQANGQLQLFVNGKSVLNINGLILRDSGAGSFRGMQMQTFFGGSKPEFATPKDQEVFFSDFSIAITETL